MDPKGHRHRHCKHHVKLRADDLGTPKPRSVSNGSTPRPNTGLFKKKSDEPKDTDSTEEVLFDSSLVKDTGEVKVSPDRLPSSKFAVGRDRIYYDPSMDRTPESLHSERSPDEAFSWSYIIQPDKALTVPTDKLVVKDRLKRDHKGRWTLERRVKTFEPLETQGLVDRKMLKSLMERNEVLLEKVCLCETSEVKKNKAKQ